MRKALVLSLMLFCNIVSSQGFKVRHLLPQRLGSMTKEVFEVAPGAYLGLGIYVDTSSGSPIDKLVVTGLGQNGELIWTKQYGTSNFQYYDNPRTQRCMIRAGSFFYYVGHAADFNNRVTGVFIKFSTTGDTIWQRKYYGVDTSELVIPQMVTKSIDGGFLLTGLIQNSADTSKSCLLLKTDANGYEIWRKKITKTYPKEIDGRAIVQDSSSKKIIISGYQSKFNNVFDAIIITDSLGNQIIQKSFTAAGGLFFDHIQTSDNNIIAVGYNYSGYFLGGQNTMRPLIVKFDFNNPNNIIWKNNSLGILGYSNGFTGIVELPNKDLLVSGFVDTVQGVVDNPNSYAANTLIRFVKFDQNGIIKENRLYNYKNVDTSVSYYQGMNSFHLCQSGGWVGAVEVFNNPFSPLFFVRYDSTGCDTSAAYCQYMSTLSIGSSIYNRDITIFPNPSSGVFTIETPNGIIDEIVVYNVAGQEIRKVMVGEQNSITISGLPSGIYLLQATKQKGYMLMRQKVIIN